jgi:hypothetical protein
LLRKILSPEKYAAHEESLNHSTQKLIKDIDETRLSHKTTNQAAKVGNTKRLAGAGAAVKVNFFG